jgi:threonine 3-dehydrogenase
MSDLPTTMRALAKTSAAPGLELIERPVPATGPGEVLLRVEAASICGTDHHIYDWDAWATENVRPPVILGHEIAGRVVAMGPGVSRVVEGDLVGVESHLFDGTCSQCQRGNPHLCRNLRVIGVHRDGGYAEYLAIPEQNAVVSNGLDPAVVALQEPMGNAVHAAFAEPIDGRVLAVTGCGPIGLCAVRIARAAGAALVIATDTEPYRLELATRMGAHAVVDARQADAIDQVIAAAGGEGVDVVLEMSGAGAALQQALHFVRRGGSISLLGIYADPVTVDLSNLVIEQGLRLHGIFGRRIYDTWERTQHLLRSGGLDVSPVLTHRFDLADWERGFELIASRHAGKVVLTP